MTGAEQTLALAVALGPLVCCALLARELAPGTSASVYAAVNAVVAVVWDLHKAPYEGPAILVLDADHGLTVVDLVVPVSLATSAALLWRHWRASRRPPPDDLP